MRNPFESAEPTRMQTQSNWRGHSGRLTRLLLPTLLTLLLIATGWQIFFGRNSLSRNAEMDRKIQELRAKNEALRLENQTATKSSQDPERRLEVIEGKARSELGLIKRDEIFVQTEEAPRKEAPTVPAQASSGNNKEQSAAVPVTANGAQRAN